MEALFDAQLAQSARTLLLLSRHELAELQSGTLPDAHIHFIPQELRHRKEHEYEPKISYQIWSAKENKLLVRSDSAPIKPLSQKNDGFSDRLIGDDEWRVFSISDPDSGFRVQIGEHNDLREELIEHIARRVSAPMLGGLPLLALLIWFGVGRGLRPLLTLAGDISRRAPNRLDAIDMEETPEEIQPLVESLNRLFTRVERAFENERRFTADAAHELRTPLAALKTQAQVALRTTDEAARRHALEQVVRGVDRATHLVEQLLTLARLDPQTDTIERRPLDLCTLAVEVMAELASAAAEQGVELELAEPCIGNVTGNRESLGVLLRNLVDNAIRYTPGGGRVEVSMHRSGDEVCLSVSDSGPGIPEAERARVFERFYRSEGSAAGGCGLGLSIVRRVADLHGARMRFDTSPLGGLRVEVCLVASA